MNIVRFIKNDGATTAVEYAVMLMLIIGVLIAIIQSVGGQSGGIWGNNSTEIDNALSN
jgi:Flp pilus assembly pilin Flp